MRCFLCDCSVLEDDALYDRAYAALSDERKKKADFYKFKKDRYQSIVAGLFIRWVEKNYGKVSVDENGKPRCKNLEFNISHSGKYVAFAYSESSIGVDIERIGRNMDIAKRVMAPEEYEQFISNVKEEDKEDAFCRMWTAKESYMKCKGLGFRLPPESFRMLYGYEIKSPDMTLSITEFPSVDGYHLSVCSMGRDCSLTDVSVEQLLGMNL